MWWESSETCRGRELTVVVEVVVDVVVGVVEVVVVVGVV